MRSGRCSFSHFHQKATSTEGQCRSYHFLSRSLKNFPSCDPFFPTIGSAQSLEISSRNTLRHSEANKYRTLMTKWHDALTQIVNLQRLCESNPHSCQHPPLV